MSSLESFDRLFVDWGGDKLYIPVNRGCPIINVTCHGINHEHDRYFASTFGKAALYLCVRRRTHT